MGVTTLELRRVLDRVVPQMSALEQELNAADGKLGDGDTGVMLRKVMDRVSEAAKNAPEDLGAAFKALAAASSGATGSSLGTLLTIALSNIGKGAEGKTELDGPEFGHLLEVAGNQMLARGGASLGDKTVVDVVHAVAVALSELKPGDPMGEVALLTAQETLEKFRMRPCRMGRARMFGDKSIGVDDPGMLAFLRMVEFANG